MTYQPSLQFKRTIAERRDQVLSWQRCDQPFFAAGACHILAWAFLERYPFAGFAPYGLRRVADRHAFHVYVSDGTWAFDHDGWTLEEELLEVTRAAESQRLIGEIERLMLADNLENFCTEHHSRRPADFAFDPWSRALTYLATFDPPSATGTEDLKG